MRGDIDNKCVLQICNRTDILTDIMNTSQYTTYMSPVPRELHCKLPECLNHLQASAALFSLLLLCQEESQQM